MLDETGGLRAAYMPYTYPGDPANIYQNPGRATYTQGHNTILADGAWLGIALQSDSWTANRAGWYDPPQESVLSKLFTPQSQGGLGVYRPAFYEGWPFPRVTCAGSAIYATAGRRLRLGHWRTISRVTRVQALAAYATVSAALEKVGSTVNVNDEGHQQWNCGSQGG